MNWKAKAFLQNIVSCLPESISYALYYLMQKHFGALKEYNPIRQLSSGVQTWGRIKSLGFDPKDGAFFELGTGKAPIAALAYWLMGARQVITVDANPYARDLIVQRAIDYMLHNEDEIRKIFGNVLIDNRLEELFSFAKKKSVTVDDCCRLCNILYLAPADARDVAIPSDSIDYYTSYDVLEHVNAHILPEIFCEGNRIVKDSGLFVHCVDYCDHFAYSDNSISILNFLQFSDTAWHKIAGNRYMYMNRLRHDDVMALFHGAGHRILMAETGTDACLQDQLATGCIRLAEKFQSKPTDVLLITSAWIASQKKSATRDAPPRPRPQ